MQRRRSRRHRSRPTPSSNKLDKLLKEGVGRLRRRPRQPPAKRSQSQVHYATLSALWLGQSKNLMWQKRCLAYPNGSAWFERLNVMLEQDIEEMRVLFLQPISRYYSNNTTTTTTSTTTNNNNFSDYLYRIHPKNDSPHVVFQQWWARYGDYGAPDAAGDSIVLQFIDAALTLFVKICKQQDQSSTTASTATSRTCTRTAELHTQQAALLLISTICSWSVRAKVEASKFQFTITNNNMPILNCALQCSITKLRTASNLPFHHNVGASEALILSKLVASLHKCNVLSLDKINVTFCTVVAVSESTILSILSTPAEACDCARCSQTVTMNGLLDGCPLGDVFAQGLKLKIATNSFLTISNDVTAYNLAWQSWLTRILTNQKEIECARNAVSKTNFKVALECSTCLPMDVINVIIDLLKSPNKQYGKVLYRRFLFCRWVANEQNICSFLKVK
jgi:hypothetical protein